MTLVVHWAPTRSCGVASRRRRRFSGPTSAKPPPPSPTGTGPQVRLLALEAAASEAVAGHPLDILGAGAVIVVALLTRVEPRWLAAVARGEAGTLARRALVLAP